MLVLLLVVVAVASWFLSGLLIDPVRITVHDNIGVVSVRRSEIVLARRKESLRNGEYGLDWPAGHAVIGPIVGTTSATVTRKLFSLTGRLGPNVKVGLDPDVWTTDPRAALGIGYRSITFPDPLGPMPAWFVSGPSRTWVLFVHGIDGKRQAGLRPLATLHALGMPALLIDYRNDVGAPQSPDRHIHLGMTEWQDLDAAAHWAVGHGARRLVLYGESMGGTIVTRFMHLSSLAGRVVALVLDAPVLNWAGVIANQASRFDVPFMALPVKWMVDARIGVDWGALDEIAQAGSLRLPILLFQGDDDPLVPPSESRAFAITAPGPVTYVPVPGAGHIQSWNANPASYTAHLRAFLAPWASRARHT